MHRLEVGLQFIRVAPPFFWEYFFEYFREVFKDVLKPLFYYHIVTIIIVNHLSQSHYVIKLKPIVLTDKHFLDARRVEHNGHTPARAIPAPLTE